MRWMYCTNRPETNLIWNWGAEVKRRFLIPLWNVYSFFVTYASLDLWTPKDSVKEYSLLDRWILSKLQVLIKDVTRYIDDYDPFNAAKSLEELVDELSTWFVRRSRRRFWKSEADVDKKAGYTALYACLTTLIKLLAPFIPFTTEEMYQNLVCGADPQALESVHHNGWPRADESLINEDLMNDMNLAIRVCRLGRSARSKAGIKLRQPLSEIKVIAEENVLERLQMLQDLIKDELNVKELNLTSRREDLMEFRIRLLPEVLGKKHGRLFPRIRSIVASIDANTLVADLQKDLSVEIEVDGRVIKLLPQEVEVSAVPKEGYSIVEEEGITVGLNTKIIEDLMIEGLARDIVRRIQNQRKDAGFNIADHIKTYYEAGPKITEAFTSFEEYIAAETLSTSITKAKPPEGTHIAEYRIGEETLTIGIVKAP